MLTPCPDGWREVTVGSDVPTCDPFPAAGPADCAPGEAHELVQCGIDSDAVDALPILSGGGALGNGRMHGIPQMLECYLQLSGRAGERQRSASVGLACHASPHLGGAVVLRAAT